MADEITATVSYTLANGSLKDARSAASVKVAQTTAAVSVNVQATSTTAALLVIAAGVATAGLAYIANLDDTNAVELCLDVSGTKYPFCKISPGDPPAFFRIGGTLYIRSVAGTPKVEVRVLAA